MIKNESVRAIAIKAFEEGRLWFRCSDQYGRSCNGGDRNFRPDPATARGPGKWTDRINRVSIRRTGYHVTSDPLVCAGCVVSLVEVDEVVSVSGNKAVCHSFRVLDQVLPWDCIETRIWVSINRPFLERANLEGANLARANLERANLKKANLRGANLARANLERANLKKANLERANLEGADLKKANLRGAYLERANLARANLEGANLEGVNLRGANLRGAYLGGVNLEGVNLEGVNLEDCAYKRLVESK